MKHTKRQLIGSQRFIVSEWMWVVDKISSVTHAFRDRRGGGGSFVDIDTPSNLKMGRGMKFDVINYRRKQDGIPAYFECVAKKNRRNRTFWVEEDELLAASKPVEDSIKAFVEHVLAECVTASA